jgi:hypothetical protein
MSRSSLLLIHNSYWPRISRADQ